MLMHWQRVTSLDQRVSGHCGAFDMAFDVSSEVVEREVWHLIEAMLHTNEYGRGDFTNTREGYRSTQGSFPPENGVLFIIQYLMVFFRKP